MKIIKKGKLIEQVDLVEASENEEEVEGVIEDPAKADMEEIADAVEAGLEAEAEAEGNDELEVSDQVAKDVAKDVKEVSAKLKIDTFVPSAVVNDLTKALDEALSATLLAREEEELFGENDGTNYNVLVTGLPGSGKTAVVKQWAKLNKINLCYVDAKNDDLEAFINGFTVRDNRYPDQNKITKGSSDGLALLERERSVLFLDELNRQTKRQIRASLLTLINEHRITGDNSNPDDQDGYHYFKNLLFTVACINPALPTERGADDLDDAEDSRFLYKVNFDSNKTAAIDYFSKVFEDKLEAIEAQGPEFVKAHLNMYIKLSLEKSLALQIVNHPIFAFDGVDDLDALHDYSTNKRYTLFNLRMLFQGIKANDGKKDKFLNWLDTKSNFRPRIVEMLHEILEYYKDPEIKLDFDPVFEDEDEEDNTNSNIENVDDEYDFSNVDDNDEADTTMWTGSQGSSQSGNGNRVAISPTEVQNKLSNFKF